MKKFAWALLAFASLAGVYCCIVGAWAIHQDKLWFGVVLLVAGLAALFGATTVIMRWRSKAADEISKI